MKTERRNLDQYPTDTPLTWQLLKHVPGINKGPILEPTAGAGRMADVLALGAGVDVITNDIDPQYNTTYNQDATQPTAQIWARKYPYVISNLPYNVASHIVPLAWQVCTYGMAFLMRLSYLEPTKKNGNRGAWLKEHEDYLSHLLIFGQPRPSYTQDGKTDNITSVWLVWHKYRRGGCIPRFIMNWNE